MWQKSLTCCIQLGELPEGEKWSQTEVTEMVDELSQLCPVQFIEGINENQKPIVIAPVLERGFWRPEDVQLAIPYLPSRTYALCTIAIYGSADELSQPEEHSIGLYTDSNNAPGENLLTEGKLTVPAKAPGEGWLRIDLQPIVVFAKQRYWIALRDYSRKFKIGIAQDGDEICKTFRRQRPMADWETIEEKIQYMLKFYGRVLPVASYGP